MQDPTNQPSFILDAPPSNWSSRSSSPTLTESDDDDNDKSNGNTTTTTTSTNSDNNFLFVPDDKLCLGSSPTSPIFPREFAQHERAAAAGDLYDATLPPWRAAIRRRLVVAVERESSVLAKMQESIRSPWLDAYFVYTSSLGTHTFFMTVLPALFFFGYEEIGRGLLLVLASGVYFSSVVKDLICSPRPFAPPVTRLTIGTHHLEYGFPSTHSTNSVSIALFFFSHVHRLAHAPAPALSQLGYYALTALLALYTFSIVFGRLYTAMHSFTDCMMGILMGTALWWAHDDYWGGFSGGRWVEAWCAHGGWSVPMVIIPLCLLLVNQHPQPVDDCPCFEDAIAFVSVVGGSLLARWHAINWGFDDSFFVRVMPGSASATWEDTALWWGVALLKMVFGILTIFTWRLLAKSTLHVVLPPTFRFLARSFRLPNRRFYTPATDYTNMPSDFSAHGNDDKNGLGGLSGLGIGLRAVPSVIDLPGTGVEVDRDEFDTIQPSVTSTRSGVRDLKFRKDTKDPSSSAGKNHHSVHFTYGGEEEGGKSDGMVKHYDADVLTKVIVYAGIAVLSCEVVPIVFESVGWGVKSWV